MDQIIDIATDGRHLSRDRGFLKVSEGGLEIGRTPLDQIAGVIVHGHGTILSTSLLTELADRGAPVVLCGRNNAPRSVLMPLEGHHAQGGRLRAQWQAKTPLMKQAWKQVITCKVTMQAAALEAVGQSPAPLQMMIRKITSGDSTNIEAQAARHYWPLDDTMSPVSIALTKLATSLGQSFETGKLSLSLPRPPDALTLSSLGA